MPESVRPANKAHEQVFLLAKSSRYCWDTGRGAGEFVKGAAVQHSQTGKQASMVLERVSQNERAGNRASRNIRTVWVQYAAPAYSGALCRVFLVTSLSRWYPASTSAAQLLL